MKKQFGEVFVKIYSLLFKGEANYNWEKMAGSILQLIRKIFCYQIIGVYDNNFPGMEIILFRRQRLYSINEIPTVIFVS